MNKQEDLNKVINDAAQELIDNGYESFLTYRPGEDEDIDQRRGIMMKKILNALGDKIRASKETHE